MAKIQRCGNLRARSWEQGVDDYYDDLQQDRKQYFQLFYPWSGIGYGIEQEDGSFIYRSPEQIAISRRQLYSNDSDDRMNQFIQNVLAGGTNSSSCYSVFFAGYKSAGRALLTEIKRNFLAFLPGKTKKEIKEKLETVSPQMSRLSVDDWFEVAKKISNTNIDEVWDDVAPRLFDPNRELGAKIRTLFDIRCRRPNDRAYCAQLMEMVGRQLRSASECYRLHMDETDRLKKELEKLSEQEVYPLVCALADYLSECGSGLSRHMLFRGVEKAKKPANSKNSIQIVVDELRKPRYKKLLESNYKSIKRAYAAWKIKRKLQQRRVYPRYTNVNNDCIVPIGLTGLGHGFTLSKDHNCIVIDLPEMGTIKTYLSNYFGDLTINSITNGYNIEFQHFLNFRGRRPSIPYGQPIQGVIKEIGLHKKDGKFFVHLSYSKPINEINFTAQIFFQTASLNSDLLARLPDKMVVMGIDLGLANPISAVVATIGRDMVGPIKVLDYGCGQILESPKVLTSKGKLSETLSAIKADTVKLRDAIRQYKDYKNANVPISEETNKWLSLIDPSQSSTRLLIQFWVKNIFRRLNVCKDKQRKLGYDNLKDAIYLLDAMDNCSFMLEAFVRIHLKPKQQLQTKAKFDTSRANFRDFITRKLAFVITKNAVSAGCNLVFVEDLNFVFDKDDNRNSMLRLFAAATLIQYIEEGLQKAGIGLVKVAPDGTSKTDPVTGLLGHRFHNKLYVERNEKIGYIQCDPAASLNVLLRGLGRSVCPYKFFVKDKTNNSDDDKNEKKRTKAFLQIRYGTTRPKLIGKNGQPLKGFVYYRNGNLIPESEHRAHEEAWRQKVIDLWAAKASLDEFEITSCGTDGYKNFSVQ
jgi:hypothetical protein